MNAEMITTWAPLITALAPLVLTFIGYLVMAIRKKNAETAVANLEIDVKQREWFNQLVQFGIDFAINKTKSTNASVALVTTVVEYVSLNGPDVMAHFKLTAEKLADIVTSRLQGRADVETGVASTPTVPSASTVLVVPEVGAAKAAADLLGINSNALQASRNVLSPTL